jgi:hypothetical protein
MKPYSLDYEPTTSLDRDRAIKWFRSQARATQRLLSQQMDPRYTLLSKGFDSTLVTLLALYQHAINRLAKLTFTTRKATP